MFDTLVHSISHCFLTPTLISAFIRIVDSAMHFYLMFITTAICDELNIRTRATVTVVGVGFRVLSVVEAGFRVLSVVEVRFRVLSVV